MPIINLDLPPAIELAYLRGPIRGWWEALIRQRLPSDPSTIRYAVGFGTARDPDHALTYAILALEHDPQLHTEALITPTCAPPDDLADRLSNLLTPQTAALSPPKFRLKTQ